MFGHPTRLFSKRDANDAATGPNRGDIPADLACRGPKMVLGTEFRFHGDPPAWTPFEEIARL